MANFIGITASNGPRVDREMALKVLSKYGPYMEDGTFSVEEEVAWNRETRKDEKTGNYWLRIYGYDYLQVGLTKPEGVELIDWDDPTAVAKASADCREYVEWEVGDETSKIMDFLKAIQPALHQDLIVQCVGYEKCRFPLAASVWLVPTGSGKIEYWGIVDNFEELRKARGIPSSTDVACDEEVLSEPEMGFTSS